MTPEHFTDDVAWLLDPAETGNCGCLLPQLEDPPEGGEDDGDD